MNASPAERQLRVDLAAAYRLVAMNGWDDLVYTHISASVPGDDGHYLINPFGLAFSEVTPDNLVKVDLSGRIVEPTTHPVNPTGFAIHGAVHAARPDARCVMHLHAPAGIAVSMLRCGLLPLSQHAMRFHGHLGYHDYEGVALDAAEQSRLVANLGRHPAMILRNHGTLTCGRTVAEAYVLMATLETACRLQLAAMAASPDLVVPPEAVLRKAVSQLVDDAVPEGAIEWPSLLRRVRAADPAFDA
jgi:ribulose-5-phosphate 4-epimerase/fuculose-1-phosphate aldolase